MVELKPHFFRVIEGGGPAGEPAESPTEHVGAFLREARENTGRSLADIAAFLRIRATFLQAIEDGRYGDLPGPTYVVGFIRSYADYLGLDAAALLAQFKTETSGVEGHPDLEFPVPSTDGWFPTGTVVSSCAVLAAAVFGGWFFLQIQNSVDAAAVPPPPGFKSPVGLAAAAEQPAASADGESDAMAGGGSDDDEAAADATVAATAYTGDLEDDTPRAATGETVSNDGGEPYRLPVPITALVAPDPVATEASLQQPEPAETPREAEPVETVREAEPPAAVATATTPAEVAGPPTYTEDELTPASTSETEAPPPPAVEPRVAETPSPAPPSPSPAEPKPAVQVAALPSIPADGGENNTSDDGRTYGVINQQARVVIGARADSWVQVHDGKQNVLLTRMLRTGDRYLVPDRQDLVMLTGNAGGLIISVDGEPVPRIGSDGAILHNVRLDVELLKAGRAVIQ